jgi:hypothetical protein
MKIVVLIMMKNKYNYFWPQRGFGSEESSTDVGIGVEEGWPGGGGGDDRPADPSFSATRWAGRLRPARLQHIFAPCFLMRHANFFNLS